VKIGVHLQKLSQNYNRGIAFLDHPVHIANCYEFIVITCSDNTVIIFGVWTSYSCSILY